MKIEIGEYGGLMAHGAPAPDIVNRWFGALLDRFGVNLQMVWDELVADDGFVGDAEVFFLEGGVAYRLTTDARTWLESAKAPFPGPPKWWKGRPADFDPAALVGDGAHNLARSGG